MTSDALRARMSPVRAVLARLRRKIRQYVMTETAAWIVGWLGLAFWTSLAVDWSLEPAEAFRAGLLAATAFAAVALVVRMGLLRIGTRLSDASMALLLERRYPQLGDSLVTAVELTEPVARQTGSRAAEFDPDMLAATCDEALARCGQIRVEGVLRGDPLRQSLAAALCAVVSVGVFAAAAPDALATWSRRNLLLSAERWPRMTHLSIEGFGDGTVKVARGSDLTIRVRADAGHVVPDEMWLSYRFDTGARGSQRMVVEGAAIPGRDPYQEFSHTFQGLLHPLEFDVSGGDDRIDDLRVEVVDSPALTEVVAECRFADYIGRAPRDVPVAGRVGLPQGTRVTLRARANKPLRAVGITLVAGDESPRTESIDLDADRDDPNSFRHVIGEIAADTTVDLVLTDADGITSARPVRLLMAAVPDAAPVVQVQLRGVSTAITPQARLPFSGPISDDYRVDEVWLETEVDGGEARRHPLAAGAVGRDVIEVDEGFEVAALDLQPGARLATVVKARDNDALGAEPNVGAGQRMTLELVTPDKLRTMLEARELNLRRRFETIVEEVEHNRASLRELVAADASTPEGSDAGRTPAETESAVEAPAGSNTPADVALARLRVTRSVQYSKKNGNETAGVADAFDDLRAEMINNRIETDELISRLKEGIADPLHRLVEIEFPEFEARLGEVEQNLESPAALDPAVVAAEKQADAIVSEMRRVLGRMLELETYNEVVAMLRSIVDAQDDLNQRTERARKDSVLNLLED